jgi:hypothetical protein
MNNNFNIIKDEIKQNYWKVVGDPSPPVGGS